MVAALLGFTAAMGHRRTARSHRRALCKTARRAILEDIAEVADEALSTLEDVTLHLKRLTPWLSREETQIIQPVSSKAEHTWVEEGKKRIVVLGTGWAAHAISKVIDLENSEVCIVSPRNYFIFTPMLPCAAMGTVEFHSILEHIRSANPTLHYYQGLCTAIDVKSKEIQVQPVSDGGTGAQFRLPYDVLVVAVGLRPSSLGVPGVEENCFFMKGIQDAQKVRRQVTEYFEMADLPTCDEATRKRLLTFAVVGGGPTGVEFCGEMSDFLRNDLRRFYPKLAPLVRILLIQRGGVLLPSFDTELQAAAYETLKGQGIEIVLNTKVVRVDAESIQLESKGADGEAKSETVPIGLCLWSAGQGGQPIVEALHDQIEEQQQIAKDKAKGYYSNNRSQLFVDGWLRVKGVEDGSIIALGDCSRVTSDAEPLPQSAQVAAQQGAYVARLLNRGYDLTLPEPPKLPEDAKADFINWAKTRFTGEAPPFKFLDLGQLAYVGGSQAVAEVGLGDFTVSRSKGRAAFLLWRSVYIVKQVSLRNRVLVLFDWIKTRIFGRDLTRV